MITDEEIYALTEGVSTTDEVQPHTSEDRAMMNQSLRNLVETSDTPEEMQEKVGEFLLLITASLDESDFDMEDEEDVFIWEAISMARKNAKKAEKAGRKKTQKKANNRQNNSRRTK